MLAGAGLASVWHHTKAHRFFSAARWSVDQVGLALLDVIVRALVPPDAPIPLAVDDSLFKRRGRKIFGAAWHHDAAAPGRNRTAWGNTWVVVGVLVHLPFVPHRTVCLPVLARLSQPTMTRKGARPSVPGGVALIWTLLANSHRRGCGSESGEARDPAAAQWNAGQPGVDADQVARQDRPAPAANHRVHHPRGRVITPDGLPEATTKANLQRMLASIPLTDDERAAVDDGHNALDSLLDRLADVPTPSGPTPREIGIPATATLLPIAEVTQGAQR